MKASYCVDYLSHQWTCDDLIQTYKETNKQHQKYIVDNITSTTSLLVKNEKRLKKSEQYKILRYQNALWRSMARNCTSQLSRSNKLIDPSTVSWQKESDITWLYGPMYRSKDDLQVDVCIHQAYESAQQTSSSSSLQGLKPVLKKQSNVTQILPSYSDAAFDTWSGSTTPSSVYSRSGRSSFSSISSSSSSKSIGVHFNPEIIEIEYQPEYPVSSPPRFYSEEEEEEEDALWSLLVQASLSLKSSTYTRLGFLSKCLSYHQQKQQPKSAISLHSSAHSKNVQMMILLISMMKSVVSMTTTWLLWQTLSPITWLTKKSKPTPSSAGQFKQPKKTHIINL